jgi:copper resistance protein B
MPAERENPPVRAAPAEALEGPAHAADRVFGEADMAWARQALTEGHGAIQTHKVMLEEFEWRARDGADLYAWEGQAWFGGDINKLWLKSEGEGEFGGGLEKVEAQALWSRAIDPWFNLELGVRHDFRAGPDRTYVVAGVQGLAPYWFEVSAGAFLSDKGEFTARLEADYDLRLTQRLILQPSIQLDLAAHDVPELRLGSGLTTAEFGLRLRYEIVPELAPYVGFHYERAFGRTADFRRADGEDVESLGVVAGVRFWF